MWQGLLVILKSFGSWLASFIVKEVFERIKDYLEERAKTKEREAAARKIIEEIKEIDKLIPTTPQEGLDELRKRKIALEESLLNGKS